jgi:hypothetical protein
MMDCKRIDELLVEYLYQELDPSQVEHFEAHLQVCSRCAQELSSYERTRAAVRDMSEVDPPPQVTEALLKEAARAVEPQPIGFWDRVREMFRLMVMHPAMTAAVTLVLVLGVSFYVYRQGPPRSMRSGNAEPEMPLRTEIDRPLPETAAGEARPAQPAGSQGEATERGSELAVPSAAHRVVARAEEKGPARTVALRRAKRAAVRVADEENYSRGMRASKAKDLELEQVAARERQEKSPADPQQQAPSADLDVNKKLPAPAKQAGYVGQSQGSYGGGKLGKLANLQQPATPPASATPKPRPAKPAAEPRRKYKASGDDDLLDGLQTGNSMGDKVALGKGTSRDAAASETSKKRADQSLSGDRVVLKGKGKGRTTQGKPRVAARRGPATAAYWRELGDKAAAAGLCSAALGYYNRAVEIDRKLLAVVTPKVRTCATAMARGGEAALAAAQKTNPRLSTVLGAELERARKAEAKGGATGERVRQQQQASPRRAVRAKAAPTQAIDNAAK